MSPAEPRGVAPGEMSPGFSLPDDAGSTVALTDFRGRPVVLYFYPKANARFTYVSVMV